MKHGVIYADPPWAFRTRGHKKDQVPQRAEVQHYKTMSIAQLVEMGPMVQRAAADDCALFMWVVDSHLEQAFEVIRAWGFTYKTIGFLWWKPGAFGMGYWTRKRGEVCLMATRGKPKRKYGGVDQGVSEKRREHSRKPDAVRDRIMQLVDGPYLELFARERAKGWRVWGNQTEKFTR